MRLEDANMTQTIRNAAENLFRRPKAGDDSNAARLEDVRNRQALRRREQKLAEKQERLDRRLAQGLPA